ncbi:hypothetical protein [Pontibacter anaerobius]|uniref:Uncharacterized protein n=1 Tax=Pontibacter anaerobius TaxID=2993940 RepID=A0ABT3RGI0_9BACT|nr:hypothetical protein [Pontibacter anaerobius]MCX2740870.1 hypothetical protein [Pontibacter anaerobius]
MVEDRLNELERNALAAAQEYRKEYVSQNRAQDNMLTWLRNDVTGEMVCLTKGGYSKQLSKFIAKLN